ncbi:MAG: glycosyltransferase family 1 protein [Winogradskyella sp.]|uniref:glycosyltransferase n=1 Tax=Winogradskyella sp. TaxID=1883156 RepID=UPI000F3C5184|nr:glycosyltransferase [Winogradskyella sp.]RNC86891.1 MAG: glycosyltransferase family 1 protein [Winogradskyella sp.]
MAKRIKILYTIPNFDTAGSGKVVYDLVKHIDKSKFEPQICCFHTKGKFFEKIEQLGVPVHVFSFQSSYYPLIKLPYRIWRINIFFRNHDFDLIHSWHWSSDFTEPLAAKLSGIPYVYTKKAMGWGNRAWHWRSKLSSKIITINTDMKSQFFSNMKDKIEAIPIGLNVEDFGILDKAYQNEDGYNVKQDDFVIVSIANLVAVKGIELLLEAVKQLNDPKIKIFIVGDDTSDYAIDLIHMYESANVVFTGKKQNIKSYLALADVFVIPTKDEGRKEGQPIAPIEAMLSGRIVLGSRISGIKDILAPFQSCIFKPNDVKDIKSKIEYVRSLNSDEKLALAQSMYDFAFQNYALEGSIEKHQILYQNLVNSSK